MDGEDEASHQHQCLLSVGLSSTPGLYAIPFACSAPVVFGQLHWACAVPQEAITDEQIVLRSMFPEIEEIPSTIVWGKRSHRYQFGILLKPCTGHDDAENHVAVRLVFRLPPKYPKAPALVAVGRLWTGRLSHPLSGQIRIHATAVVVQVEHIRGLSDNQLQELSRILNDHAGARVGTPCVLDICENCLSEAQGLPCSTSVPLLIRIHLTPFQTAL
jgi:hypothetical protein